MWRWGGQERGYNHIPGEGPRHGQGSSGHAEGRAGHAPWGEGWEMDPQVWGCVHGTGSVHVGSVHTGPACVALQHVQGKLQGHCADCGVLEQPVSPPASSPGPIAPKALGLTCRPLCSLQVPVKSSRAPAGRSWWDGAVPRLG